MTPELIDEILERAFEIVNAEEEGKDLQKAIDLFESIAPENMTAAYWLGYIHSGNATWQEWNLNETEIQHLNFKKAAFWFQRSAELGDEEGQYRYALCCLKGLGREIDFEQAVKWARLASEQKLQLGLILLAFLHLDGIGVKQDRFKAIGLLEEAAKLEYSGPGSEACVSLARLYFEAGQANEVPDAETANRNYRLCFEWAARAEKMFHLAYGANYYLANLLLHGYGVIQDSIAGKEHLERSCRQKEQGGYYLQSQLEKTDGNLTTAKEYLEKAVEDNDFPEYWKACISLGGICLAEQKPVLALIHFSRAKSPTPGLAEFLIAQEYAKCGNRQGARLWLFKSATEGYGKARNQIILEARKHPLTWSERSTVSEFESDTDSNERTFAHEDMLRTYC